MIKNLLAMEETQVWSLGQKDPLEKRMATHSSILAWRIPWTEEPGWLQSMGSQRVGHNWATNTHIKGKKETFWIHLKFTGIGSFLFSHMVYFLNSQFYTYFQLEHLISYHWKKKQNPHELYFGHLFSSNKQSTWHIVGIQNKCVSWENIYIHFICDLRI